MRFLLPLVIFAALCGFLWKGLSLTDKTLASTLIGQSAPAFQLNTVEDPNRWVSEDIFRGKITLLNVWASWCHSCQKEHEVWMTVVKPADIALVGLNYHDTREEAGRWLQSHGNPYRLNILDERGRLGMDYGVTGTPETFVIDKNGVIRYRHVGPVDREVWDKKLFPLVEALQKS